MSDLKYCVYCQRTAAEIDLYEVQAMSYGPDITVCADKAMSYDLEVDIDECDPDEQDLVEMLAAAEDLATDPASSPATAAVAADYLKALTVRIRQ